MGNLRIVLKSELGFHIYIIYVSSIKKRSELLSFCFRCLGVLLQKVDDKAYIRNKIDLMYKQANISFPTNRLGLAKAMGLVSWIQFFSLFLFNYLIINFFIALQFLSFPFAGVVKFHFFKCFFFSGGSIPLGYCIGKAERHS